MDTKRINVFWFRRDLRVDDNCGLYHALKEKNPVLAIFVFDTDILDKLNNKSDARVQFIHQRTKEINEKLRKHGSYLKAFHSKPIDAFKALINDYSIDKVFINHDYEPSAKMRDKEIKEFLSEQSIDFQTFKDHVIFESLEIVKENDEPYKVYTPYKNKWLETLRENDYQAYPSEDLSGNFFLSDGDDFPTLEEIGFKPSDIKIPNAEFDKDLITEYDKKREYPAERGTSRLGIHLRHGTVSIRKAVKNALHINKVWLQELIWREFYMMILDNFPKVVYMEFNPKYKNFPWKYDEKNFEKWCSGKTGYPIVDAGMRQLNETGYMHNRVRMITASFLTKHLLIDWRWGEAYFSEKLLDYELASNNGGWQWAAGCGTDAQPYFRIFNPTEQTKKFDPRQKYIKKWVPELNSFDYPNPIIDHKFARNRAIETFKKALQQ